jgi:hypothetical protein
VKSGYGNLNPDGTVDVVLSDADTFCDSAKSGKVHPGETLVQMYGLSGKAPGVFTPNPDQEIKFAIVAPTCASGQAINSNVAIGGRATASTITLTSVTAAGVQGTLALAFEDGSKVGGAFDVPSCSATLSEKAVCF